MHRLKVGIYHFIPHQTGGYAVPGGRIVSLAAIERFAVLINAKVHIS